MQNNAVFNYFQQGGSGNSLNITPGACPHPGSVLLRDFMVPAGLSVEHLARTIGLSVQRMEQIVCGERRITYMTALRLSACFGTRPEFWMDLQEQYDATITPRFEGGIGTLSLVSADV